MTDNLVRPLTPTEVRRAHQLLGHRDTLVAEFKNMTDGGSLPTLKTLVLRGAPAPENSPNGQSQWELMNLTNTCGLDRDEIERRVVVAVLTLLSERIDEIDRQLRENGVAPPMRPAIPAEPKGGK